MRNICLICLSSLITELTHSRIHSLTHHSLSQQSAVASGFGQSSPLTPFPLNVWVSECVQQARATYPAILTAVQCSAVMPAFEYQSIPSSSNGTTPAPSSPSSAELCRRRVCSRGGAVGLIFALFSLWLYASKATHDASLAREPTPSSSLPATSARQGEDLQAVMHISDTHVDPYFDPTESMMKGVCHRCDFNSKVWGKDTACPDKSELRADHDRDDINRQLGYAFGRYGCNPPYMLWKSLHKHMQTIDADPKVIVFTGDISPHGYPDDKYKLKGDTTVDDLCETKFLVTRQMIRDLVRSFPNTKWAYTLGNNDHMPKNIYWQPYIDKYGKMLLDEGFFTPEQYDQVCTVDLNVVSFFFNSTFVTTSLSITVVQTMLMLGTLDICRWTFRCIWMEEKQSSKSQTLAKLGNAQVSSDLAHAAAFSRLCLMSILWNVPIKY